MIVLDTVTAIGDVFDSSGWMKIGSLLLLSLAHEDVAITFGGYFVVNDTMSALMVALTLLGGIVAADFALYGLGAVARRIPWMRRLAARRRGRRAGAMLARDVFGLVALCRVVPGMMFVALVGCGWARVSLPRFFAASLLSAALYLPPMLYLVVVFGDALDDHVGFWAWPMLLAAVAATGFVRKRVFDFGGPGDTDAPAPQPAPRACGGRPCSRVRRRSGVTDLSFGGARCFDRRARTGVDPMIRTAFAVALLVAAAAPAQAGDASAGPIKISAAWARATPKGASVGGGYLTITNTGTVPDRLVGGASAAAGRVEVHSMSLDKGVMRMRKAEGGLEIKPGETVTFSPRGYHLMFIGLKQPFVQGGHVAATLRFEKAGTADVDFTVEGIGAQGPGGSATPGMPMHHEH